MTQTLQKTKRLACSVPDAFHAFTAKIDLWWPVGHRKFDDSRLVLEPQEGGRFLERAGDGQEAVFGEVLACDPPHSIRFTWHPGKLTLPTEVDIRFEETPGGTVVHVTHSEGAADLGAEWGSRAQLFDTGWTRVLDSLSEFLDQNS